MVSVLAILIVLVAVLIVLVVVVSGCTCHVLGIIESVLAITDIMAILVISIIVVPFLGVVLVVVVLVLALAVVRVVHIGAAGHAGHGVHIVVVSTRVLVVIIVVVVVVFLGVRAAREWVLVSTSTTCSGSRRSAQSNTATVADTIVHFAKHALGHLGPVATALPADQCKYNTKDSNASDGDTGVRQCLGHGVAVAAVAIAGTHSAVLALSGGTGHSESSTDKTVCAGFLGTERVRRGPAVRMDIAGLGGACRAENVGCAQGLACARGRGRVQQSANVVGGAVATRDTCCRESGCGGHGDDRLREGASRGGDDGWNNNGCGGGDGEQGGGDGVRGGGRNWDGGCSADDGGCGWGCGWGGRGRGGWDDRRFRGGGGDLGRDPWGDRHDGSADGQELDRELHDRVLVRSSRIFF